MKQNKHFHRELEKIKKQILGLSAMVEERVHNAVKSVEHMDTGLAEQIIATDHEIDEKEVEIEEECLKIIALHQPVAIDLRFLVAVIKINNDLERIADLAVNMARRITTIAKNTTHKPFLDYGIMGQKVKNMLSQSLDALVQLDSSIALEVCAMDDEVDQMKNRAYDLVKDAIKSNPDIAGVHINYFLISRHLERIADHVTNISEEILYLIEGEIVRHVNN